MSDVCGENFLSKHGLYRDKLLIFFVIVSIGSRHVEMIFSLLMSVGHVYCSVSVSRYQYLCKSMPLNVEDISARVPLSLPPHIQCLLVYGRIPIS